MSKHNFKVLTVCTKCGEPQNYDTDVVILITLEPEMTIEVIGGHDMSDKDLEEMIVSNIPNIFKRRGK